MKKIYLVLTVLVAVFTAFGATDASAACPEGQPYGWCFEHNGVQVEAVPTSQDPTQFPQIVDGNSLFIYKITTLSGKQPNFIDILIPLCTPDLGDPFNRTGGSKYAYFNLGAGDPNTGFGLGLSIYRTFQWSYSGTGYISFTLPGKVFSYPNALFLNRGTGNYAWGEILSPACAQLPYHEFTQEVPYTVQKEVSNMGLDLCIESTDESGCPTSVFSCSDPSYSGPVCGCPGVDPTNPGSRTYWNKQSILDAEIPPGKLRQAWSEHDSRCPRTWWHNEGSCQYNLTVMGRVYTYTGPTITGTVYSGGNPVSGAWMKKCKSGTCTTQSNSVTTNSSGYYSICVGAQNWIGTLQPQKTNLTFTTKPVTVSNNTDVRDFNWP